MRVLLAGLILALVDQSLGATNAVVCANCTYSSGLGYIGNDDNCNQFFQCVKRADGSIDATLLCCVEGTFWAQDHLGCVRGYCIDSRDECPDIPSTTDFPCPLEAFPGDDTKFIDLHTYEVQDCAAGTVYSAEDCACVAGGNTTCDDDPLIWFPFACDFNDIQCHKVKGTPHGNALLVVEDGYVHLDGDGDYVSFGFLENYFAWKRMDTFAISIWFNQSEIGFWDDVYEGVFGNGDCNADPSIWLGASATFLTGGIRTDQGSASFEDDSGDDLLDRFYIQPDYWCQFGMICHNNTCTLFLNGVPVGERTIAGHVANTVAASTIGMAYLDCLPFFWNGALDDFMFFDRFMPRWEMEFFVFGRGRTGYKTEGEYTSTFHP